MNLRDILDDWDDISPKKKREAVAAISRFIEDTDDYELEDDLCFEIIQCASYHEEDDVFGTDGLQV